jgi:hypothetical protein
MKKNLWTALEAIPDLLAVESEWQTLMGAHFGHAKCFLDPESETAKYYPCPQNPPCGRHRVRRYPSGRLVAAPQPGMDCISFPLTEDMITVYRFSMPVFANAVIPFLGALIPQMTFRHDGSFFVGSYGDLAIPILLVIEHDTAHFERRIRRLHDDYGLPIIVLTTTPQLASSTMSDLALRSHICVIPLSEYFDVQQPLQLLAGRDPCRRMNAFHSEVMSLSPMVSKAMHKLSDDVASVLTKTSDLHAQAQKQKALIEQMSDGPDKFFQQLRAHMNENDFNLFTALCVKKESPHGPRYATRQEVAKMLKLKTRQAVHNRINGFRKRQPEAWDYYRSITASKTHVEKRISELSDKRQRSIGADESYTHKRR